MLTIRGKNLNFLNSLTEKLFFPANKNSITIKFRSDANNNRKGFMGQIIQLRNSCAHSYSKGISNFRPVSESRPNFVHERQPIYLGSYCDIFIGEVVGDLRSPGFPYGYANNHSCVYSIRRYKLHDKIHFKNYTKLIIYK